ncbi:unnamed protein product [Cladocopium goreaui]|uniref:Trophinin n=1 Tax=Cladocopium goreaui TaxID=2562237 RepID=A0A9P1D888_9DINO|nr:unnamed protein product [Cladocopium goreaui]
MQLQSLCRMQSPNDPYAAATKVQSKPRSGRPEHKQIGAIASALILGITLLFRNKQLTKVGRVFHMEVQQISTAGTGSLYSPQSTFEMPWTWRAGLPLSSAFLSSERRRAKRSFEALRKHHLKSEWGRSRYLLSSYLAAIVADPIHIKDWLLKQGGRRLETDSEETLRLKARIDVLEEAWALRSTTVGQRAEESIARVEEEVKKIWRELLSKERNPSKESGHVEAVAARLIEDLKQRLEKTQSQVAELNALKPEDVDSLMKKMIDEVGHSVKLLGDRCSKLEVELATMQATDVSSQADRERTEQLEKMVDLLLQQRRQDLQESQANFREVEARFLDLDQRDHAEKSWRQEAEAIRKEIQEVRSTHVPSLFQQHMKAMKAMQEGLAAVRAEVKKLSEVVEAVQASSTPRAEAQADGSSREVLALKAQVSDLQEQVTLLVVRGLEERFANLRADVSREAIPIGAWPASQAELSAEMQSMRSERQEDRGRLELLSREAEGLGRQVVHIRRELSLGPRPEAAEEPPAPVEASSNGGLLEGLFSETPKAAKGTIRSAAKMASMATSRSPRRDA